MLSNVSSFVTKLIPYLVSWFVFMLMYHKLIGTVVAWSSCSFDDILYKIILGGARSSFKVLFQEWRLTILSFSTFKHWIKISCVVYSISTVTPLCWIQLLSLKRTRNWNWNENNSCLTYIKDCSVAWVFCFKFYYSNIWKSKWIVTKLYFSQINWVIKGASFAKISLFFLLLMLFWTLVHTQPVGVIGAITPWNFPLDMITRKVCWINCETISFFL